MLDRLVSHLLSIVLLFWCVDVLAYKEHTHALMSERALERSTINSASGGVLGALGLGASIDDQYYWYRLPTSDASPAFPLRRTPAELVFHGAIAEDLGTRGSNHFYDPQLNGSKLSIPSWTLPNHSSADWALEDDVQIAEQSFSYADARRHLSKALFETSKEDRDRNLGLVFETLGHLIHHIEDMAQPQHVRSEEHCDNTPFPLMIFGFNLFGVDFDNGCKYIPTKFHPSAYELYTYNRVLGLPLDGYAPVDYTTFDKPRLFWQNEGKGIAEFTSDNFVSIRTNFGGSIYNSAPPPTTDEKHPRPAILGYELEKHQIDEPELLGPNQPLRGEIWFIGTHVDDKYRPNPADFNIRTSSFSIFADDLKGYNPVQGHTTPSSFSLNSFNYRAANDFLLPRAVGYSEGLLNYFFRGQIEVTLPSNGVYSVVDHAVTSAAGTNGLTQVSQNGGGWNSGGQGFTKIKLKLRNITPDGIPPGGAGPLPVLQNMSQGTLVAIAKYIPNPCYQADLLGEFSDQAGSNGWPIIPSGCSLITYFSTTEQISVSKEQIAGLDRTTPTEYTFDFSANPIPINARDLSIQVVYRGVLGTEQNGIGIGGKNISEPTYLALSNSTDRFAVDGIFYDPAYLHDVVAHPDKNPALASRLDANADMVIDYNVDPVPLQNVKISVAGVPIAQNGTVQATRYLRLAILADADPKPPFQSPPVMLTIQSQVGGYPTSDTFQFSLRPSQNQLARKPGERIVQTYSQLRGVPFRFVLTRFKDFGVDPTQEELRKLPSLGAPPPPPTSIPLASPWA